MDAELSRRLSLLSEATRQLDNAEAAFRYGADRGDLTQKLTETRDLARLAFRSVIDAVLERHGELLAPPAVIIPPPPPPSKLEEVAREILAELKDAYDYATDTGGSTRLSTGFIQDLEEALGGGQ